MDERCNTDNLYERKFPRGELPIEECIQCVFNVLCNDYTIYEESKGSDEEKKQSMKDCEK